MPIPRCLVEAPWERPEPEHAVLAVKAPRIARGRVDPERAAAAVSDAEADAKLFREFTKAAVATRSAEMDAFCKERLAKGQTWNARGLVHVMSDDAAFEAIAALKERFHPSYLVARFGDRGAELAVARIEKDARVVEASAPFIESIELACICARDLAKDARRAAALAYFARWPETAAIASMTLALPKGRSRAAGREALRVLARTHAAVVLEVADRFGARAAVEHVLRTTEPLDPPKLSELADVSVLPPVRLREGEALPASAVEKLLGILALSPLGEPLPDLAEARDAIDPRDAAELVWALAQAWLAAGGPPKEGWAFEALGHLGDDEVVRKLAPLVRAFPKEGFHKRAQTGLDVLGAIGTQLALVHVLAIAQRNKFEALQRHAQETFAAVAKKRGLGEDELADRVAPTTSGDDAKLIEQMLLDRLELAMSNGRSWSAGDFRRFVVEHPVVTRLAQSFVWRVRGGSQCFRIDDAGALTNAADEPFALPNDARVVLLHPADVEPSIVSAFAQLFGDYRIVQPFEQLGRSVHAFDEAELAAASTRRFSGRKCPTHAILNLDARTWRRAEDDDHDMVVSVYKRIGDFTAILELDPGFMRDDPLANAEQSLLELALEPEQRFDVLLPSQRSDLLRDVERLVSR